MGRFPELTLPTASVFQSPYATICVNVEWIPVLLAVIERLEWRTSWEAGTNMDYAQAGALNLALAMVNAPISESCENVVDIRIGGDGSLEKTYDGTTWIALANWVDVPGDTMTGNLTMAAGGATGGKININPATSQRAINIQLPATAGDIIRAMNASTTTIFSVNNIGRFALRGSDNNMFGVSDAAGAVAMLIGTLAGNPILTLTARASQSADIFRVFNNAGVLLAAISQAGAGTFTGSARLTGQSSLQTRDMAMWRSVWEVSTDATRKAQAYLTVFDNAGEREILRGGTDGASAKIGFLGASPVLRQAVSGARQQNAALQSMITAFVNMGLITDATTAGTLPVDGASAEMRVSGGYIQWRQSDDDPTWTNLIALADLEGEEGIQGIQGIQGEPGEPGADGECPDCEQPRDFPPNPEYENDPTGTRCSVAHACANEVHRVWNLLYDQNLIDSFFDGLQNIIAIAAVIFPGLLIPVILLEVLIELLQQIKNLIENGEQNAFTEDAEHDFACMLYCILGSSWDGTIQQSHLDEWASQISAYTGAVAIISQAGAISGIAHSIPLDQYRGVALTAPLLVSTACDDCDCDPDTWCWEQAVTHTGGDFVFFLPDDQVRVINTIDFCIEGVLFAEGGYMNTSEVFVNSGGFANEFPWCDDVDSSGQRFYQFGLSVTARGVAWVNSNEETRVKWVRLRGQGSNPFGADNCE